MELTLSWFLLLNAAAALQGLALACALLLSGWRKNPAHLWLGAYVLAYTLGAIGEWMFASRALRILPHFALLFDWLVLWLGPFCYGYVRVLLGLPAWSRLRTLLHLLPGLLMFLLLLPAIGQSTAAKRAALEQDFLRPAAGLDLIFLMFVLQALGYLLASMRLWFQHRRALEQHYSNTDALTLNWLRWLLLFNIAMWCAWLASLLFGWQWAEQFNQLGFAFGVYALGYRGMREPIHTEPRAFAEPELEKNPELPPSDATALDAGPVRYAKSAIEPEALAKIIARLQKLMQEQQAWRENELSLGTLAERLGVRSHDLSQALNSQLGQSFFDYVNGLRVADVQSRLAELGASGPPLLELALASGFASKATFNATFKRITGVTPSAWRAQVVERNGS